MSIINRKEFLRLSAWGFVASLLPLHEIKALSFISNLKTYNQDNHQIAVDKAKIAKEHFFKKEYSLAEDLYLECINLAPADIRFYDNLQNVFGAQGKILNSVELFKNALMANPNKIAFYDRAAKSLMRLELGDKVIAQQYRIDNNSSSLLQDAKQLYNQALALDPDKEYLTIGKKKIKRKIDEDAVNKNYKIDADSKLKKRNKRKKHNKRYKKFTNEELIQKLDNFEAKKRNTLYIDNELLTRQKNIEKEKKLLYRILIKRYKREDQFETAINYAEQLYNLNKSNSYSLRILKRLYRKTNAYGQLVNLQQDYVGNNETVYSNLGLMHFLQLAYRKQALNINAINQSIEIGEDLLNNWSLLERLKIDVTDKLAKSYLLSNNSLTAQNLYMDLIENLSEFSTSYINKILLGLSKSYFNQNNYQMCENICLIGIQELIIDEDLTQIQEFANRRLKSTFKQNIDFYYLLYRVYKKTGDGAKKEETLNFILQNDPENKFALKRLS